MTHSVTKQPGGSGDLYPFNGNWHQTELCGPFCKACPKSAMSCFCNPCFTARLTRRVGDHLLTCCLNPCSLMAVRTKVRTAYKIQGSLIEDCYTTVCCVCPCTAWQINHELDHQQVPAKPGV